MKKTFASVLAFLLVFMMVFAGLAPTVSLAAESRQEEKSNSVLDAAETVADWFDIERQGNELVVTLTPDVDSFGEIYLEDVKEILNEVLDYSKDIVIENIDFEELIDEVDTSSFIDLLAEINEISLNGYVLYGLNEDGKAELDPEGIRGLLCSIPNFEKIAEMSDEEMQLSFDARVETESDSVDFSFTFKVGGGHEYVRSAAKFLSSYINVELQDDNTLLVDLFIPKAFSKALLKAANDDRIDPELKAKVFGAFVATGDDVHALINELSYEDLIDLLECIDFEGAFDSDFVQQFVDLSDYTNEEVIEKVEEYEELLTDVINRGVELVDSVANMIPDKYMDVSFMDLVDKDDDCFYYSNGEFSYVDSYYLTYDGLKAALEDAADAVGVDKDTAKLLLIFLPQSFKDNGFNTGINFSIEFDKINRVDYVSEGETLASGFLPAGAKVEYFVEATDKALLGWADESLNLVVEMPDRDVVLNAIYNDGKLYSTVPTAKEYNGESETVGVLVGDNTKTYEYRWYKNGALVHNTNTFEVVNVADSGTYVYEVWCEGEMVYTGSVEVTITPKLLSAGEIKLEQDAFEYTNGNTVFTINVLTPAGVEAVLLSGTTSASAFGDYSATFKLVATDPNYVASPETVTFDWCVKRFIKMSGIKWYGPMDPHDPDNQIQAVYNGQSYELYLDGKNLDKLVINPEDMEGWCATDAGTYTAVLKGATVKAEYAGEYMLVLDKTPTKTWTIDKKAIYVDDLEWAVPTETFVYDGSTYSVALQSWPNLLVPQYNNASAYKAGVYTASVSFDFIDAKTENNYKVVGTVSTFEWSIAKADYDLSEVALNKNSFVFNAQEHTVELVGLPNFVKVVSTEGSFSALAADTYTVVVNIEDTTGNYNIPSSLSFDWTIEKANVTVTSITWDYNGFVYAPNSNYIVTASWTLREEDAFALAYIFESFAGNTASEVSAEGYLATLTFISDNCDVTVQDPESAKLAWNVTPAEYNVSGLGWQVGSFTYDGQSHGVFVVGAPDYIEFVYGEESTAVNAGEYTATAVAKSNNLNYRVVGTVASCDWSIAQKALSADGVKLEGATVVYDGLPHSLSVVPAGADATLINMLNITYDKAQGFVLCGTYTVTATLTLKDEYIGNYTFDCEPLTATLVIGGDNKTVHTIKNGNEVVVQVNGSLTPDTEIKGGVNNKVNTGFEINGEKAEILAAYDIYFTRGDQTANVDGQKYTVKLLIPAQYRALAAEKLAVVYIDGNGNATVVPSTRDGNYMVFTTDHFSTYAVVRVGGANLLWLWILIAVLLLIAIAVVLYFVLIKGKKNAPAPEAAPVAEAPAAVEEPVKEEAVEEVVEEEPAAEPAPVVEEPQTAVLVMGEDGKEATAIIGGQIVHIRFRSSFMSRLIQSTEDIQSLYTEIKNHVLSYKGIKARGSWNYEAFNKGRTQLVKLNVKGKTLIVNLNLDPKEFNINKYHFIDCSDKPKYDKVPMMMKVRSARALKYTIELIDEMMAKYEITQGEVPTEDYRMPYETTEALAKRGLVKVILPAGVTLSDDMTLVHVNVSELLESGSTEKSTEQIVDVPFKPVVEVLEDGTVHADAEYADQLVSDEEAQAKIEIVTVDGVNRSGKMGEINLDTICENFEDGDVVDVDALKAKRLVSSKVGRVKVLARGIMYKKLTVKASKFSLQAVKMISLAGGKVELEG